MCAVYIPRSGEREALKSIINAQVIVLGLYKEQIVPDGSTTVDTLTPLDTGANYGYAEKTLENTLLDGAPAANVWAIGLNSQGQAQAQYGVDPQLWTFLAPDVAANETCYGVFGYTVTVPFTVANAAAANLGAAVVGAAANGTVTGVTVQSGNLANKTAIGFLNVKVANGTFGAEQLTIGGIANCANTSGQLKKLVFIEALTTPVPVNQLGQQVGYTPILAMSTL